MSTLTSISSAMPAQVERYGVAQPPAVEAPADVVDARAKRPSGEHEAHDHSKRVGDRVELTAQEKKEVAELKKLDAEVRRHEQAHLAAAGPYGKGPPTYEYKEGPDGKQYATSGHVEIDATEVEGDPEATLEKARIVKQAALAPSEPSNQDRKVAREAEMMAQKAERELRQQEAEETAASKDEQASSPKPSPLAQGYDRQGSPLFKVSAPAQINIFA